MDTDTVLAPSASPGISAMRLNDPATDAVRTRREVYESLLPLAGSRILELGCGAAEATREIATSAPGVTITALEIDRAQHEKNRRIDDLPNVRFVLGSAESIPAGDATADIVLMFRSLHHVPVAAMDRALGEIARVLRPGGLAYFEEPVFAGDYTEMVRIFHDEEHVRAQAFLALQRAVAAGTFDLAAETFFLIRKRYRDWAQFEAKVREETHTVHNLTAAQWTAVKTRFAAALGPAGAQFLSPMRVDVLRKR
jgi:ubiquinone/menaquinone biosynthesis C-methylase UbiE